MVILTGGPPFKIPWIFIGSATSLWPLRSVCRSVCLLKRARGYTSILLSDHLNSLILKAGIVLSECDMEFIPVLPSNILFYEKFYLKLNFLLVKQFSHKMTGLLFVTVRKNFDWTKKQRAIFFVMQSISINEIFPHSCCRLFFPTLGPSRLQYRSFGFLPEVFHSIRFSNIFFLYCTTINGKRIISEY